MVPKLPHPKFAAILKHLRGVTLAEVPAHTQSSTFGISAIARPGQKC